MATPISAPRQARSASPSSERRIPGTAIIAANLCSRLQPLIQREIRGEINEVYHSSPEIRCAGVALT
jgi:hypothetical protein